MYTYLKYSYDIIRFYESRDYNPTFWRAVVVLTILKLYHIFIILKGKAFLKKKIKTLKKASNTYLLHWQALISQKYEEYIDYCYLAVSTMRLSIGLKVKNLNIL